MHIEQHHVRLAAHRLDQGLRSVSSLGDYVKTLTLKKGPGD